MRMAAYCRVSTEKEEQLSSLKNQREFFEQYAEKNGDTLVGIYADEGISGKSMKKRDAFIRLLNDSENDKFDYVAVKDISRFARNTSDFLYGIRTLRTNGVDVRFLSGNQTVIGESEFILTVFAALAQEESANLSKRVIFGKKQNAKKGRVPNCVYGYDKKDTFTLSVNEKESGIVRLIFKWYTEGEGSRRIAARLNEMGIPTKKNAKWISKTVRRILENPVYTGRLVNNKSVTKDFLSGTRQALPQEEWYIHERPELRIISDEIFALVQEKIVQRREAYAGNSRYSGKHIFSNLIKCAVCQSSFTARVYHWENTYVKYRCCAHNAGGNTCCQNSVTVDEGELLYEIKKYLISAIEDREYFLNKLNALHSKNEPVTNFVQAKESLIRRRKKLKEMYVAGIIDMAELKGELADIDAGIKSIDNELDTCSENRPTHIDSLAKLMEDFEFTNEDMRAIIDKIVVHPERAAEVFMK